MKTLEKKFNALAWKARLKAIAFRDWAQNVLTNEDGDTNFLSIIIILAIVLILAVVFIALKDEILDLVRGAWDKFSQAFSGQDTTL